MRKIHQLAYVQYDLFRAVRDPSSHWKLLDQTLSSSLLPNSLHQHPCAAQDQGVAISAEQSTLDDAMEQIIQRLPRVSQKVVLVGPYVIGNGAFPLKKSQELSWNPAWFFATAQLEPQNQDSSFEDVRVIAEKAHLETDRLWSDMLATNFVDTNSLVFLRACIATTTLRDKERVLTLWYNYINVLSDLMTGLEVLMALLPHELDWSEAISVYSVDDTMSFDFQTCTVVRAFVWTAWHRSIMLHLHQLIGVQLQHGSSLQLGGLLAVRGIQFWAMNVVGHTSHVVEPKDPDLTSYCCNWALDLLLTSRVAQLSDFRTLTKRLNTHFHGRKARCIKSAGGDWKTERCDLYEPNSCQRFTEAETNAQSAHRDCCDKRCPRIRWNEVSYRNCQSPRAVSIGHRRDELQYVIASRDTLAISHVWAHGQGGRPEDGINTCLHQRYCDLASKHGCDSYWIDSACIPSEGPLRREAIGRINDIFTWSKVVLISDEDLLSIDVSMTSSIGELETVLSVLLLCDWNVRAWTLLEATRASGAVHLLCRKDTTIALLPLLKRLWGEGAIDLAILAGCAEHLLPETERDVAKKIEDSGLSLLRRHASRSGDDVIIWSLLSGHPGNFSAINLWKRQSTVQTAYLMSSAPRITDVPGFGWAPSTPTIIPHERRLTYKHFEQVCMTSYYCGDSRGSYVGTITPRGLAARWLIQELDITSIEDLEDSYETCWRHHPRHKNSWLVGPGLEAEVGMHAVPDYPILAKLVDQLLERGRLRVLKPAADDGKRLFTGGDDRKLLPLGVVVLCFLEDGQDVWEWKGVYTWPSRPDEQAPTFDWFVEEMVIG
ncbi:hypothetical protein SUNI508_04802 [Seiridium unicorne]|uniref:Heterokaryon incompatibility domain-containing protein n=1 Tax=Seiridium unicorne TaxID=138068 RepID=A0ABR2V6G3_9PEZI